MYHPFKAARTPDHIKKKVIELLYLWSTKELKGETKIGEAYTMLKKQGIIQEDPVYVGDAVFASGQSIFIRTVRSKLLKVR